MKKHMLFIAALLSLVFVCSCSAVPDSKVNMDEVSSKLLKIDEHKNANPVSYLSDAGFRGVPFGSSMQDVINTETLTLTESYTDALDYEKIDIYTYSMVPTYRFNEDGLFYRGSYQILSDNAYSAFDNIAFALKAEHGDTFADENYYSFDGEIVYFDSSKQARTALSSGEVFYYIGFEKKSFFVELFLEKETDTNGKVLSQYLTTLAYTDYDYYDY